MYSVFGQSIFGSNDSILLVNDATSLGHLSFGSFHLRIAQGQCITVSLEMLYLF